MQREANPHDSGREQCRAKLSMEQILGYARAAVGASKIPSTGSSRRYVTAMESRYRQDMAWEQAKARVKERIARKGGQTAASQI